MEEQEECIRRRAIGRYLKGEKAGTIYRSLGRTKRWFYKWLKRFQSGDSEWYRAHARTPHHLAARSDVETEGIVKLVRMELYNRGEFCGAQAIIWRLEEMEVEPLPSLRTVNRILDRHGLTHRRTGRYEPKGKRYPALDAPHPGSVHQTDLVGPCYLSTPLRFYSLNTIDLATGRCGMEPVLEGKATVAQCLWATWLRLGIPQYLQMDNEATFYGSPAYPRALGKPVRLCLLYGVQPCFIPLAEPWRNGVVEKFNDLWRAKFLGRVPMESAEDLKRESLGFEQRHNARWKYTKLSGKTPLDALAAANTPLRFPDSERPPTFPLPKPETGFYHIVRFIRSDGIFNLFGEKFPMPAEAGYEYIWATVDVSRQQVSFFLDTKVIDERAYHLR